MPCDMGYANHDLFEYVNVLSDMRDICNKAASEYVVLGGDFKTGLSMDTLQKRALRSFVYTEQMYVYVLMTNVLIYLIHTAQRAIAVSQQLPILR